MSGNNYTYSMIGAVTSQGQALEYRFDFGDGGYSPWSPATSAAHSWGAAGLYSVKAEARYGSRTAVSPSLAVAMAAQYNLDTILVPGGTFPMGRQGGNADEQPVHEVTVSPFCLDKYEVTFDQYDAFCDDTGRTKPVDNGWGRGSRPVINVTWANAKAYSDWAGKWLPTEAEWECACRAGGTGDYSYGSDPGSLAGYAWYSANSGGGTQPVGGKGANAFGLYDMHGNVQEWCADWYDAEYYSVSPSTNPPGPALGTLRVLRGGSWSDGAGDCRSASRSTDIPAGFAGTGGFRCASPVGGDETMRRPGTPSGPTSQTVGSDNGYGTSGTRSSLDDPVEYRFNWGDGAYSATYWSESTWASHAWTAAGTYTVTVEARCRTHPAVTAVSAGLAVRIYNPPPAGMAFIPAGKFRMGSTYGYPEELPVHEVTVGAFYIDLQEVSFDEYDIFCAATSRVTPADNGWGRGSRPVINVTWADAKAYCDWDGKRLPTEAEWEYACRAGGTGDYCYGSDIGTLANYAWYNANSGAKTQAVGGKNANNFGLFDMYGNVREWCADWYDAGYYTVSPAADPPGPALGTTRVLRGGSWVIGANACRSASRGEGNPAVADANGGFRCVATP
jgi:formylglycine-generating enzyme required for sulfatase activity